MSGTIENLRSLTETSSLSTGTILVIAMAISELENYRHALLQISALRGYTGENQGRVAGYRVAAEIAETALSGESQHSDDLAVDRFASAMKAKLAKKRGQGFGGWNDPEECHIDYLVSLLTQQIHERAVLDPVDIGNFAMMIFNRPESPTHGR